MTSHCSLRHAPIDTSFCSCKNSLTQSIGGALSIFQINGVSTLRSWSCLCQWKFTTFNFRVIVSGFLSRNSLPSVLEALNQSALGISLHLPSIKPVSPPHIISGIMQLQFVSDWVTFNQSEDQIFLHILNLKSMSLYFEVVSDWISDLNQ